MTWWFGGRGLLAAGAFAWALAACGSSSGGSAQGAAGDGNPTGIVPGTPECAPFEPCGCPSGLTSQTQCDTSGTQSCDCTKCPTFTPVMDDAFNACGGRVFGAWHLKSLRYVGGALLSQTGVSSPLTCPENLVLGPTPTGFVLNLQDGGTAVATDLDLSATVQFLGSCAQGFLGTGECENITLGGSACTGNCGLCSCPNSSSTSGEEIASWSTTGTVLTLQISGEDVPYDYCVAGGELTLHRSGVELAFDSVVVGGGQPQACAARSADTCAAGIGCHLGVCGPDASCAPADSEADCNVHSACNWQATGCGGTAPSTCALSDYGTVPGCDFLAPCTVCKGTQQACTDRSIAGCTMGDGCAVTGACVGPSWDCTQICVIGYGCYETDNGCIGSGSCALGGSEAACTENLSNLGCTWQNSCAGTVKACSDYGVTDCMAHTGCTLGAP